MSEAAPARSAWRDFLNRREPGARWMLVLLVLVFAGELGLLFTGTSPAYICGPLVITLAAIFTARWWSLPTAPAFSDPRWEIPASVRRWVWLMTAAVAMLAMWPRTERLKHGLSDAEMQSREIAYCYQREHPAPLGDDKIEPSGARRLVTGHVAAQFAEQVLKQEWRAEVPPDVRTIRTLPWSAGILTAGLIVLLAAALGSPRAGLAAGLIAAMHPQCVQLSSELTDAPLQMLALAAALLCVLQALRTNRWHWWAGLGAAQALYLLGNPHGWLDLVPLQAAALAAAYTAPVAVRDRVSHALRLLVAAALSGLALCIPGNEVAAVSSGGEWWGRLLYGVQMFTDYDATARGASFVAMTREAMWRSPVLVLLPALLLAGLFFMQRHDWRTRLAGGVFLLSTLLIPATGHLAPALLLLPIVLAWAGVGLMRRFPGQTRFVHAPLFIAVLYVLTTSPALQRTVNIPAQPLREVLAATASQPGAVVAAFGRAAHHAGVRSLTSSEDLAALVESAFDKDTPLLVLLTLADSTSPGLQSIARELASGGRFVLVQEFPAFAPADSIRLYRYQAREQIINLQLKPEKKTGPPPSAKPGLPPP